jgi:hypothetical protein
VTIIFKRNVPNKVLVIGNAICFFDRRQKRKWMEIITDSTMDEEVFIFNPNAVKFMQLNVLHVHCVNGCV